MDKIEELFKSVDAVVDNSLKLCKEQADDSYLPIQLPQEPVNVKISYKNNSGNKFNTTFAHICSHMIQSLEFKDNLDKFLHQLATKDNDFELIDKSPQFILELEIKMKKRLEKLSSNSQSLDTLLVSICKSIAEQLDSLEIDLDTIKILFSAMEANLILSDFGSKIFLQLSKNKQIHPEWVPLIREWNITLKEKTLSVDIKEKQDIGIKQLQTFNVVPTVDNKKLPEIFQTYFGFSVQEQTNWKAQLGTILKMISKEHSQSICFMVSYTNRYQSYFDLSNIVGKPAYVDYKGVNSKMIDDMEILKREPSTQGTKNMITLHAYNNPQSMDNSTQYYMLWTKDYIHFHFKEDPIAPHIAQHIIRQTVSKLIDAYNKVFEKSFFEAISKEEATSFPYKQAKYNYLDSEEEQKAFTTLLFNAIMKILKSLKMNTQTYKNSKEIIDKMVIAMNKCLYNFKPFKKLKIPLHAKVGYYNACIACASKIYKDIIQWMESSDITMKRIEYIVDMNVNNINNPYTSFLENYILYSINM